MRGTEEDWEALGLSPWSMEEQALVTQHTPNAPPQAGSPWAAQATFTLDAGREPVMQRLAPTPPALAHCPAAPTDRTFFLAEPKAASGGPPAGRSSALCSLADCVPSLAYLWALRCGRQ